MRTAVATLGNTEVFGWLAAVEAQRRGFYQAVCRAFVGDGGNWIAPLGALHFHDWVQIPGSTAGPRPSSRSAPPT